MRNVDLGILLGVYPIVPDAADKRVYWRGTQGEGGR